MMARRKTLEILACIAISIVCCGSSSTAEVDLADNAALQYWKAFASLPDFSSEQTDAVREALKEGVIDGSLEKIIESSGPAFREMRKGAQINNCEWGISFEEGPDASLPHLGKARQLARLACLRAEMSFQDERSADAIDDIVMAFTLGRHVGRDAILISLLVDYSIERMALETVASHLQSLDADELSILADKLGKSPERPTVAQAVAAEKELLGGWVIRILQKPDGKEQLFALFSDVPDVQKNMDKYSREELLDGAKELQGFYDKLIEAVALSPDEAKRAEERLKANPGFGEPGKEFAQSLVPAIGSTRRVEAAHETRLAMLRAAIAVARDGQEVLKKDAYRDPFGTGPFAYKKTNGGFRLQGALEDRHGQPIALEVGRP